MGLSGDGFWRPRYGRRSFEGEPEVLSDARGFGWVSDEGFYFHRRTALFTDERVSLIHLLDECGPSAGGGTLVGVRNDGDILGSLYSSGTLCGFAAEAGGVSAIVPSR